MVLRILRIKYNIKVHFLVICIFLKDNAAHCVRPIPYNITKRWILTTLVGTAAIMPVRQTWNNAPLNSDIDLCYQRLKC